MQRAARGWRAVSMPQTSTRPASGLRRPATIETSDVLPAPFGPSSPSIVPGATSRSMPARATVAPYDLRSPSIRSAGVAVGTGTLVLGFRSVSCIPVSIHDPDEHFKRDVGHMTFQPLTRARRREMTKRHLMDAAAVVFARDGFHGASLDDVAAAAGFTKGAVYSNFAGKDDLFLAVFEDRYSNEQHEMQRVLTEDSKP